MKRWPESVFEAMARYINSHIELSAECSLSNALVKSDVDEWKVFASKTISDKEYLNSVLDWLSDVEDRTNKRREQLNKNFFHKIGDWFTKVW